MVNLSSRILWLLVLLFSYVGRSAAGQDVIVGDFESPDYGLWQVEGDAFGNGPAKGTLPNQQSVYGFRGQQLVNSYHGGDQSTGTLTSPEFEITKDYLCFLIGGGNHPGKVGVELIIDGQTAMTATGTDTESLVWRSWNVRPYQGRAARFKIFDFEKGGWGHVNVDHVVLSDQPKPVFDTEPLDDYRRAEYYLREPLRPRYHFSPEMNWINDPNGLVYFEGEYHLFYQYNPAGTGWGHMSWGHAVSPDLVRWEHLPLAIPEEDGVMIFSGCVVVDQNNTSGFGVDGQPALVAVYTAHQPGNQSQALAYSHDRGRTWKKYDKNPVLDIRNADFRDPKVFWHSESNQWVMVVALAIEKRVQLYGSKDLKDWKLLSEFGPRGASEAANWECPDLFQVPVEGNPDESHWVMLISIGNGAITGGSGSQYFVGNFDGERFVPYTAADQVNWVDYGRDFYAAHRWVNLPDQESKPVWIGWMNNWETSLLPTDRWRGEMSVPRKMQLRKRGEDWKLLQEPHHHLQKLRKDQIVEENLVVNGPADIDSLQNFQAVSYELKCELNQSENAIFGIRLRKGEAEQTLVEYDFSTRMLKVDRKESGKVDFHPAFPGEYGARLDNPGEVISLHILVDTTSVEVFAENGEFVMTNRIFPSLDSDKLELYSRNGKVAISKLELWELEPVESLAKPVK